MKQKHLDYLKSLGLPVYSEQGELQYYLDEEDATECAERWKREGRTPENFLQDE
jgi:hypothetical protein